MQPLGCMRASKDGGCSRYLIRCGAHPGRRPSRLARPKRPGEHLRVTAKSRLTQNNTIAQFQLYDAIQQPPIEQADDAVHLRPK
jgi:hypothetical protein